MFSSQMNMVHYISLYFSLYLLYFKIKIHIHSQIRRMLVSNQIQNIFTQINSIVGGSLLRARLAFRRGGSWFSHQIYLISPLHQISGFSGPDPSDKLFSVNTMKSCQNRCNHSWGVHPANLPHAQSFTRHMLASQINARIYLLMTAHAESPTHNAHTIPPMCARG
jgi:hypothetical protein